VHGCPGVWCMNDGAFKFGMCSIMHERCRMGLVVCCLSAAIMQ